MLLYRHDLSTPASLERARAIILVVQEILQGSEEKRAKPTLLAIRPAQCVLLKELSEKPDNDDQKKWNGPYIEDPTKLKDPWGEDYQYRFPSQSQGEGKYDLWSKGPDRQDGTDDDITNWKRS